jgi:hypothetical protein
MTSTRVHRPTFADKLRDDECSLGDLVVDLGLGHLDPPDALECPSRRWAWFANMLDHPHWGIATEVPALAALCDEAARLCRQTATARNTDTLAQQWRSLACSVAIAHRFQRNLSETETLTLMSDLAVDGADHCAGKEMSGFEALLGCIATLRAIHGLDARQILIRSTEWEPTVHSDQVDTATG